MQYGCHIKMKKGKRKKPDSNKSVTLIKSRELLWRTAKGGKVFFRWPIYLVTTKLTQNWSIILQCISALTIIKSDNVICMAIINSYLAFFFILFHFCMTTLLQLGVCLLWNLVKVAFFEICQSTLSDKNYCSADKKSLKEILVFLWRWSSFW